MLEELAAGPAAPKPTGPPQQPPIDEGAPPGDQFDWLAPLHNRLIIAGVSFLILLALTAVVLLVFSRGDGDPGTGARVGILEDGDRTPTPVDLLTALALTTTTLRNGPGVGFSPLGTVPRGARVPIIGRNADDTWLQVLYPPGSTFQGWIEASFLEVTGDLIDVDIAGPGIGPSIIVPTSIATFVFEEPTDTPAPVVEPTDEPAETPESTSRPVETETPPPLETPAPTATQAPAPTETPANVPETVPPTKGKPNASADPLTAPATLTRRPQLSMLPSGVPHQVTRRHRERAV